MKMKVKAGIKSWTNRVLLCSYSLMAELLAMLANLFTAKLPLVAEQTITVLSTTLADSLTVLFCEFLLKMLQWIHHSVRNERRGTFQLIVVLCMHILFFTEQVQELVRLAETRLSPSIT